LFVFAKKSHLALRLVHEANLLWGNVLVTYLNLRGSRVQYPSFKRYIG